jgi:two-component system, NarL family, sensor histidine kinase UhpB
MEALVGNTGRPSRWTLFVILVVRVVFMGSLMLILVLMMRFPVRSEAQPCEPVQACAQRELQDYVAQVERLRTQVLLLLLLMVLSAAGVLWLRRRDRAVLRSQLVFNQQLIDAIPLPVSMRSPEGVFVLVNKAFEEKHRMPRDQMRDRTPRALLPKEAADRIEAMDRRALGSAEPVDETFAIADERGERHVMVRVQALRRRDGMVLGVVGVQTDVTTLRQKEDQLTEINAKLRQLSVKMIGAQEEERSRIARDLHDHVGQILTALKLQLASLSKRERIDAPPVAMAMSIELAEEALRHTRDLSASLHPHLLDDLGLLAAMRWLIDRFIRPSIADVELRCVLAPSRGPQASELVAFRVVQEALTNVIRHASASRVGVILETVDGQLAIEVLDDGVGFAAGETWFDLQRATSLGMTNMRDRVSEIGGELRVESTAGVGTSLRVRLPWAHDDTKERG